MAVGIHRVIIIARALLLSAGFCVALSGLVRAQNDASKLPGERTRQVNVIPAGDVVVTINEELFNALLDGMLSLSKPPTLSLGRFDNRQKDGGSNGSDTSGTKKCESEITLLREVNGTRTAVRFSDGRIVAPVAFRGSYEAGFVGCVKFEGWADTNLALSFDQRRQALTARITVREVRLSNLPPLVNGVVTGLVQSSIDSRINPLEILRTEQLTASLSLAPGNTLRLRAKNVRHEVMQKELRLRISYEIVRDE